MTDETIRRPRRRAASRHQDMPDTHDAIEIAMKAIATGADQHASARTVLEKHAVLLDVQSRREQEEWALLRLQRLTRWIFMGAAAIVLLGLGGTLWAASQSRSLIVEPFSVPPALAERGVTGEVVAARVLDRLAEMQRQTVSIRAEDSYSNNWQDNVEVNVLDSGFSVGELWRALRQWLGKETRISGEIITVPDGSLVMTTRAGVLSSPPVTAEGGDLDVLVQRGAEGVYAVTQPYRHAILMNRLRRFAEAEPALIALTRVEDPLERRWGYSGLSFFHRVRGDTDAAVANARMALEIDPQMVPALANLASAHVVLGRDERALAYYQASHSSSRRKASEYAPLVLQANTAGNNSWISARLGDSDGLLAAYRDMAIADPSRASPIADAEHDVWAAILKHDWGRARSGLAALTVSDDDRLELDAIKAGLALAAALELEDASAARSATEAYRLAEDALAMAMAENTPETARAVDLYDRTNVYPTIAHGLALGGQSNEAKALIDQTPLDCYDCVVARGHVAALSGNRRAAEHWWREAIRIGPSIPMGYEALGRSRLLAGDASGALTLFLTAQEKGPRWADLVKGEADALVSLGRAREALRRYSAAAERAPRWGALYVAWGAALAAEGRSDEAQDKYRAAAGMDLSAADRAEVTRAIARVGRRS